MKLLIAVVCPVEHRQPHVPRTTPEQVSDRRHQIQLRNVNSTARDRDVPMPLDDYFLSALPVTITGVSVALPHSLQPR